MGLTTGGKIHISCHGNQKRAQWKLRLPSIQKNHGFELYEVNKTLLHRYPGYAPTRTNGGAFKDRSKRAVSEYIFHIRQVCDTPPPMPANRSYPPWSQPFYFHLQKEGYHKAYV